MQIRLNKNTVLPKVTVAEVQPAATKTMFYAVQQGETLFSISRKFGISVDEITKKNPMCFNWFNCWNGIVASREKRN